MAVEDLVPEATAIDAARGEIHVPRAKVGLVIGAGGSRIREIEKLTGRRWRIVGV